MAFEESIEISTTIPYRISGPLLRSGPPSSRSARCSVYLFSECKVGRQRPELKDLSTSDVENIPA